MSDGSDMFAIELRMIAEYLERRSRTYEAETVRDAAEHIVRFVEMIDELRAKVRELEAAREKEEGAG